MGDGETLEDRVSGDGDEVALVRGDDVDETETLSAGDGDRVMLVRGEGVSDVEGTREKDVRGLLL